MSEESAIHLPAYCPGDEGFFDLPASVYHDHIRSPGISRSLIVELLTMSPAHARSVIEGLFKKVATAEMTSGSLFDLMLLEPDKFKEGESHWTVPAGMDLTTVEGRAWKKDHPGVKVGGLPYIKQRTAAANQASAEDMHGMIQSLMAHKKIRRIIEESRKQESIFKRDPETGLMRKVRLDLRTEDNQSRIVVADLKSIFRGGAATAAWPQQCARKSLHIQDSFYSDTVRDSTGADKLFFVFLVVERKPPYACRIFQLDPEGKKFAREKYKRAMESFRKCQETGVWPAYDEDIVTVSLPAWELRAPEEELDL